MLNFIAKFRVGRFEVEMHISERKIRERHPGHAINVEWSPHMPNPGELSEADMAQYRAGREAAVREFCERAGIPGGIIVVE